MGAILLELVQRLLPATIALDTDLDTAEDHLLSTAEVDAELNDIAILNAKWFRLDVRLAEPDVVEERARRALYVLDVPVAVLAPQLAVLPADDLGLESHRRRRGHARCILRGGVALRVASHADDGRLVGESARDGGELQRGSAGSGVLVRDEAYRGQMLHGGCSAIGLVLVLLHDGWRWCRRRCRSAVVAHRQLRRRRLCTVPSHAGRRCGGRRVGRGGLPA